MKTKNIKFSFMILLIISSLTFATPADSILISFAKNLQKHSSFSAKFTQTRYLSLFPKPLISEGVITYSAPNNIRFDYAKPFKSVIIFSDGKMERYRFENGKPIKQYSMEVVAKAITREVMRFIRGEFEGKLPYKILYTPSKKYEFILKPENSMANSIFKSITLNFSKDLSYIKKIKLLEIEGDFIEIIHQKPSFAPVKESFFEIQK